jgi:hypothetical protein
VPDGHIAVAPTGDTDARNGGACAGGPGATFVEEDLRGADLQERRRDAGRVGVPDRDPRIVERDVAGEKDAARSAKRR